jgi:hypothetical protein
MRVVYCQSITLLTGIALMESIFDDLAALAAPRTDLWDRFAAVAVDLLGKAATGLAIGLGIAVGLALAG